MRSVCIPWLTANLAHISPPCWRGDDELADLVADGHGFDDGHAPGVTGIFATLTTADRDKTDAGIQGGSISNMEHFVGIRHRLLAMRADAAHEALGAGQNHEDEIKKGGRCPCRPDGRWRRGIIAVHRGKHLVAGEAGFDGDLGRFPCRGFSPIMMMSRS